MNILKGGGQKDGGDPVFSGGEGKPGEEVQETGENLKKWIQWTMTVATALEMMLTMAN